MGKKGKVGKARKDKFYHLAKETGYRARSAFKLLQLNRKFEFLQKSRVCVDLCAAPGGWLQVAAQHMPLSSLIIGIDLMPIKPIRSVTTFQEDITTEKCKQTLRKELQTWKADVFLNDGAPNVGKNWLHDAFQQAELTLAALKLATTFLRPGGWFVTKVFRSKDYQSLMWVFQQLFKKVHATKPKASRNESAEIFVVCQGFLAPDMLDPKFLDPKFVFKDVGAEPKSLLNLIHPEKRNKKAEGYAEGDYTLHHKATVTDFITATNHMDMLAECHELEFDNKAIEKHKLTTAEVKECCKDIKVLGKKELRCLLTWRKKMKELLEKLAGEADDEDEEGGEKSNGKDAELDSNEDSEDEELQKQLEDMKEEERKDLKRKRKKVMKEKRKLRDKMALGMVIPGDRIEVTDDINLFDLKGIKKKQDLKAVSKKGMEEVVEDDESDDDDDDIVGNKKMRMVYERYEQADDVVYNEDEENEVSEESEADSDQSDMEDAGRDAESEDDVDQNPLVIKMDTKDARAQKKMNMWFNKDAFAGLDDERDEDLEIESMMAAYKKRGGKVLLSSKLGTSDQDGEEVKVEEESQEEVATADGDMDGSFKSETAPASDSDDSDSDDSDSDDGELDFHTLAEQRRVDERRKGKRAASKVGFEVVPAEEPGGRVTKLDPIGLAIGEELVKSNKRRREIVEMSYNRYTFNDENLPDWFSKDEAKHCKKQLPVTKDQIQEYRARARAINARPIKKIAEAKARKKRKSVKKLEKARKKADAVSDTVDVTDREKWKAIKDIYKKAGLLKKKKEDVTYVVAKKGVGKRVGRPSGVKGRFKVVDPRMKKDMRQMKNDTKNQKGRTGRGARGKMK